MAHDPKEILIFEMGLQDFHLFWPTFKRILEDQETYAFEPNLPFEEAHALWCLSPQKSFVAKEKNKVLGSYFIKPNASGPGSHICNCGFIVRPDARGKGVAKRLFWHAQKTAVDLGYLAMQFNSVVSTNEVAVDLWKKLGFRIIGRIPNGYKHRKYGYVDSYIMYKELDG